MTISPPPLVSVVIPAYNAGAYLGECLGSVAAQVGPFLSEIIVVDDGSTDGTGDIARAHDGVLVLRHPVNRGPSAARNAGVSAAQGEFVAFLDADDRWPPGMLAARVEVLQRQPGAALVFGDCRQFDQLGLRPQTLFEAGTLGTFAWGVGQTVPEAFLRLLDDNFITTGSVVARRRILTAVGGFAEDLHLVEDLDLWLRIAHRHPIAWCGQVCLLRRRHDANLSRDPEAMSLAFLEVLRRHDAQQDAGDKAVVRAMRAARARELLHLADLALRRGGADEALVWATQSLAARPSARSMWRMAQAVLMRWMPWAVQRRRQRGSGR